ncbi:tetratricopeptide repeat protein [Nocardioides sp. Root190]|uniref:tetratricopeptide repeat protein n=1 Tax=Nocardioides sp. Root190 TaxID=1736488 RepID=UPI0012FB96E0|nr:hypothetical protein [Nocardioides sp. Root190]
MTDEWYRLPDWDEEARAEFERRLRKARSFNRAQYLRIKGLVLKEAGELAGARELWRRVFDEDGEFAEMDAWAAAEHLGDSYVDHDPDLAITFYRRSMKRNNSLNMTTATQPIKLAELLHQRGLPKDLAEAKRLLMDWPKMADMPMPSAHFRCNAALAEVLDAAGDRQEARQAAIRALALVDASAPFPRHKELGVVRADRRTLKRLNQMASRQ